MDFIFAPGKGGIINTINRNINISTSVDISVDSSVYRIVRVRVARGALAYFEATKKDDACVRKRLYMV
jgi:hypothetical protein